MLRECRSIADVTKSVQGDIHRRSMKIKYGGTIILLRSTKEIKGACKVLNLLIKESKEMEKLLTGTK